MANTAKNAIQQSLAALRNICMAMLADFKMLDIDSFAELAEHNADDFYVRLCVFSVKKQDPCVHDTFAAAKRRGAAQVDIVFAAQSRRTNGKWNVAGLRLRQSNRAGPLSSQSSRLREGARQKLLHRRGMNRAGGEIARPTRNPLRVRQFALLLACVESNRHCFGSAISLIVTSRRRCSLLWAFPP